MDVSVKERFIALDLGTTTLAGRLLTPSGDILAAVQLANPQRREGDDILLRLQKAHAGAGERLHSLLVDGLRELVAGLLHGAGCCPGNVTRVVAAGNPGMTCLLSKLPVAGLLFPPHKPPCTAMTRLPRETVDLNLPVPLEVFPAVSGFVGGDLVACLLTLGDAAPATLLIDIGTNAELALWDGARWWATSAAAGPAFEGGNISAGMVRTEGAVSDVRLDGDRLRLVVTGGGEARGLCGSGLAALVAAAREGGLLDASGRILAGDEVETNLARYLDGEGASRAIRFQRSATGGLLLTQDDVRHFQLAKGAVRAAIQVLLERSGFEAAEVARVWVSGALGTALPVAVLKRVALLPEPMLDKTSFVANGVLTGLQAYLTAVDGRRRLDSLLERIQPFPLSGTPAFEKHFLASLDF